MGRFHNMYIDTTPKFTTIAFRMSIKRCPAPITSLSPNEENIFVVSLSISLFVLRSFHYETNRNQIRKSKISRHRKRNLVGRNQGQIKRLRFRDFRPKNSVMVQGKIPEPSEELRPPLTNLVQGPTDLLGLDPDKVQKHFHLFFLLHSCCIFEEFCCLDWLVDLVSAVLESE
ncbi:uncharacterized protein LOC131306906 [Rhododendron vialii]|uniref:uncharacterized protein LOC131306906 n=1 Tax=Rhododendron vialii TaxID=182163 RepID=UPI00265FA305|nr:uncharacterized protein LOC131306906 [Rhododendron vialii]